MNKARKSNVSVPKWRRKSRQAKPTEEPPSKPKTDGVEESYSPKKEAGCEISQSDNCRILVVDDHAEFSEILQRRLIKSGLRVDVAETANQALEMMEANNYDLLLLDLLLPTMTGHQLLATVRYSFDPAKLPVIVVSALGETAEVVEALDLGANDFITKPIDYPALLARIRTQLRLKHLSDLKEEFVRIASHDLKNLLSAIKGSSELLIQLLATTSENSHNKPLVLAEMVNRTGGQMHNIIKDFLEFNALEDGQIRLIRSPVNLNSIISRVIQSRQAIAVQKGIRLETTLDPDLPSARLDTERILQVVDNLIGNALKFSSSGTTLVRTSAANDQVLVEIKDEGPGFTKKDLERVFAKYPRLSNKPTGNETSTGLGLTISRKIIELHGGTIGVRNNNPGPGATFWFQVPTWENPAKDRLLPIARPTPMKSPKSSHA